MDIKHTLATVVTLLCLSSIQADAHDTHMYLAKEVLETCKAKTEITSDFGTDTVGGLRDIINWQLKTPSYDSELLLQQVRLRTGDDSNLYHGIETGISFKDGITPDKIKPRLRVLESTLRKSLNKLKLLAKLDSSRFNLRLTELGSEKQDLILTELKKSIKIVEEGSTKGPSNVGSIDFSDKAMLRAAFRESQQLYSTDGILGFGLQGFNNLFGDHQGARRGETVLISALSHHYKSGTLRTSFAQLLTFNKPTFLKVDDEGKPLKKMACGIHICLENSYLGDLLDITRYFKEQETGVKFNVKNLTDHEQEEAVDYLWTKMAETPIKGFIEQHNQTEFGFAEFYKVIEKYEDLGYEVHFVTLDYAGRMSLKGCDQGAAGVGRKDLYARLQSFCLKKKITLLTAHQMSAEAKQLVRDGEQLLVKAVCGLGYYDGCRTLENEVDMEIYQHIVTIGSKHYMTWQRGKHRKVGSPTPDTMRFCVYPMSPVADIVWDVGKNAGWTSRLNGKVNAVEDDAFDN